MNENTTPWFKHDYNARRDPKLIRLARVKGMKGIGIYWSLIEIMHEQEGSIGKDEISDISFELREDENNVLSILNEFDLFVIEERYYCNTRVLQSLDERKGKSEIARANVLARWSKTKKHKPPDKEGVNTTVLPKEYDSNTTREEESREEQIRKEKEVNLIFETFRQMYPGKKRGSSTEFECLKKHKDWESVVYLLPEAIERQIAQRQHDTRQGKFVPEWKNLKTWLNNRCWEEETPNAVPEPAKQHSSWND